MLLEQFVIELRRQYQPSVRAEVVAASAIRAKINFRAVNGYGSWRGFFYAGSITGVVGGCLQVALAFLFQKVLDYRLASISFGGWVSVRISVRNWSGERMSCSQVTSTELSTA